MIHRSNNQTFLSLAIVLCTTTLLLCHAASEEGTDKIGEWWNHNALFYSPRPAGILRHMEFHYSHGETTGNVEGKQQKGQALMILRKGIATSTTSYIMNKSDSTTSVVEGHTEQEERDANQRLTVDLTRSLSLQCGAMWTKDQAKYVEDRYTYYGGFSCHLLDKKDYSLEVGLFTGYDDTSYMNRELQELVPDILIPSYESAACLVTQRFRYKISEGVTFSELTSYLWYLDDSAYYRYDFKAQMEITITSHVSLLVSYDVEYDDNTFAEVTEQYGYEKKDTMLMTGLNISL